MHARHLVELAAVLSSQSGVLVGNARSFSNAGLEDYWTNSRCLMDRWTYSLGEFRESIESRPTLHQDQLWKTVRPTIEEAITFDVFLRVWTGLVCSIDLYRVSCDYEPVARSVFIGQLEIRNRILNLLLIGSDHGSAHAMVLNRLRRRAERWTDLLLGYLMPYNDVREFGFCEDRIRDYDDIATSANRCVIDYSWPIMFAGLSAAFRRGFAEFPTNGDLNQCISQAVLQSLSKAMFRETGSLASLWQVRLLNHADDVHVALDDLVGSSERLDLSKTEHRRF